MVAIISWSASVVCRDTSTCPLKTQVSQTWSQISTFDFIAFKVCEHACCFLWSQKLDSELLCLRDSEFNDLWSSVHLAFALTMWENVSHRIIHQVFNQNHVMEHTMTYLPLHDIVWRAELRFPPQEITWIKTDLPVINVEFTPDDQWMIAKKGMTHTIVQRTLWTPNTFGYSKVLRMFKMVKVSKYIVTVLVSFGCATVE